MSKASSNFNSGNGVTGAIRGGQDRFQNRYRLGEFVDVCETLGSVKLCLDLSWDGPFGGSLWPYIQRGEKLVPTEVEACIIGEINMRESANAERLFALLLEQRDEAEVTIGRADGLDHDVLDFTPLTLDVVGCEHEQHLAALRHAALHFPNARCAAREIAEVNEGAQTG